MSLSPSPQPGSAKDEAALFAAALEQPSSSRAAFLDALCKGDRALLHRLELLLAAHEEPEKLLSTGHESERATMRIDSAQIEPDDAVGKTIGRYKLLEKLGEGGCGVVYVAEQTEPVRRRVALKVIKLGMDTKAVIARFEAERQALALMDHPNIAKVLDAGTTESGRPYFVMELVRGIRITEYCDQEKLPLNERLNLFIKVCQAIQHAHQKGIIHRDIKPSNILVTLHDGVPIPKVIDFGIAKATEGRLTDATIYTQLHQFIGTPAYMSPEQAEMSGLDIDTRSDIYSLGVLLYELLTGTTPFDAKELMSSGIDEMRKTIREKEPPRPSTRLTQQNVRDNLRSLTSRSAIRNPQSAIPSDLDWIVMKCLEKDRSRRYETANGLAADLKRHLNNEPVVARPPSAAYKLQKAFHRNKLVFAAVAAVLLTLIVGFTVSAWQAIRAIRAERIARSAEQTQKSQADQARADRDRAEHAEADARGQAVSARRAAYVAEINVAFQSLAENALDRARELLERQRPRPGQEDLRGFEWRHLWHLCRGNELATLSQEASTALAYSPNGQFLASGQKSIKIRAADSRRVLTTIDSPAESLCFSTDSTLLAGADDQSAKIWNTTNWQLIRTLPDSRYPVLFSKDGHWLLTGMKGGFRIWHTSNWQAVGQCEGAPPIIVATKQAVAFSPDSQFVITLAGSIWPGGDHFRVWKLPTLERLADIRPTLAEPGSVAFTADGNHIITGLWNGAIQLLEFPSGRVVSSRKEHTGWVPVISISPDGARFASASADRIIGLWDMASFEQVGTRRGHTGEIHTMAMSPDGKELVSASSDGTTKVWGVDSHAGVESFPGPNLVAGFTSDSQKLVIFTTNTLCLWRPETGERVEFPIPDAPLPMTYGIWGRPARLKPNEPLVARGHGDGTLELWSLTTGRRTDTWQVDISPISAVAFSNDGKWLATSSRVGIKVWDVATQQELFLFQPHANYLPAFSPDRKFIAAPCSHEGLWLFNLENRKSIPLYHVAAEDDEVMTAAFSSDGTRLIWTTGRSNATHIWEMPSRREIAFLRGHVHGINSIAIAPDGKTLATASTDRRIKLWSLTTFQELATFTVPHAIPLLDFSPDGQALAISELTTIGHPVQILRAPSFEEIARAESAALQNSSSTKKQNL